ncbi:MAG: peroxiredoxin [Bacteroidota bacterium]
MPLQVGEKAPAFKLHDTEKKVRSLEEFLGKKTVLAFFPGAFTSVCEKELCTFRDSMARFHELNAQVVSICVDAPASNKAFAMKNNLRFPVLSDYARDAVKAYDIVHVGFGGLEGYVAAKRSVFVLDREGKIAYAWIAESSGTEPNYEEITKVLALVN